MKIQRTKQRFIEMMAFGYVPKDIQNELNMSPNIFSRWADEYWNEIADLRSLFAQIINHYEMRIRSYKY